MRNSLARIGQNSFHRKNLKILYFGATGKEVERYLENLNNEFTFRRTSGDHGIAVYLAPDPVKASLSSSKLKSKLFLRCIVYVKSPKRDYIRRDPPRKFDLYSVDPSLVLITHIIRCNLVKKNMHGITIGSSTGGIPASDFDYNRIFKANKSSKRVILQRNSKTKRLVKKKHSNRNPTNSTLQTTYQSDFSSRTKSGFSKPKGSHKKNRGRENILDKAECSFRENCSRCSEMSHVQFYYHPCKFGSMCRMMKKNDSVHLNRFTHPCKHGVTCHETSRKHRIQFTHSRERTNIMKSRVENPTNTYSRMTFHDFDKPFDSILPLEERQSPKNIESSSFLSHSPKGRSVKNVDRQVIKRTRNGSRKKVESRDLYDSSEYDATRRTRRIYNFDDDMETEGQVSDNYRRKQLADFTGSGVSSSSGRRRRREKSRSHLDVNKLFRMYSCTPSSSIGKKGEKDEDLDDDDEECGYGGGMFEI